MNHEIANDKDREFLINQFNTLRTEILALKERVVRTQTISISGIPLLVAAGEKLNLDFVIIVSPIITAVVVLMLSFEQNSIMRAGRYIRIHIEPKLKSKHIIGWEEFLEKHGENNRSAEKYFLCSVIIASALYYAGGATLAFFRVQKYDNLGAIVLGFFYASLFPFYIYFVIRNFQTTTFTNNDLSESQNNKNKLPKT
ncbi:MAG: hypothetical protein PHX78_06505 [bacterium]|nr:hypothetical protein [bacterium]